MFHLYSTWAAHKFWFCSAMTVLLFMPTFCLVLYWSYMLVRCFTHYAPALHLNACEELIGFQSSLQISSTPLIAMTVTCK